jgi:mono/diheme cytochrome c family protein
VTVLGLVFAGGFVGCTNGKGAMPAFKGQLTAQQIKNVAAFVVASTR